MDSPVKRVGVVSDSHGNMPALRRAIASMGAIDFLIHAGDCFRDSRLVQSELDIPVVGVAGNSDTVSHPRDEQVELFGHRFFITHGHTLGVKSGYGRLIATAKRLKCSVAVFGHTHMPAVFTEQGILFVNPGSVSLGREGSSPGYAIISIESNGISATLYPMR